MLSIRLTRMGRKKAPTYRVVVMEKSRDPYGRYIENLGQYNPRMEPKVIELNEERIKHWLSVGAQPSDTVRNLLINAGIIKADKKSSSVNITKKRQAKIDEKNAAAAEAKAAAEEAKKAEAEAKKAEEEAAKAAEAKAEAPAEEAPAAESAE